MLTSLKTQIKKLLGITSSDGTPPLGFAPNEEFESKRTTKLGMVFVVIMVITGIWQGQILFEAIKASIAPPVSLSSCYFELVKESGEKINVNSDSSSYSNNYSYQNIRDNEDGTAYNGYQTSCVYTDIENKHAIKALYDSITPLLSERSAKSRELSTLENDLSRMKYSSDAVRDTYNTSIIESISNTKNAVYSTSSISSILRTKEEQMNVLKVEIDTRSADINALSGKIKAVIVPRNNDLLAVANEFNGQIKWLELERFLISILLLAPLSIFTLRRYFRAKNERSEFAIIWSAVALISTILSIQLISVFTYEILPHQLIQAIAEFFATLFKQFVFVLVIFQWFALILVPLFFGFLIYKIQKKYYNKEAVVMRALKDGKCPQCSMKVKDAMVFCPSCSYTLRKACSSCKHTSISYARFCEECGVSFQPVTKV